MTSARGAITEDTAPDAFWQWSLKAYGQDGVSEDCMLLQDRHHMNVNVILWCIWTGQCGWLLADEAVGTVIESVRDFNLYAVERLREVRRFLSAPKVGYPHTELQRLRRALLEIELSGEQLIQHRLARETFAVAGPPPEASQTSPAMAARAHFAASTRSLEKPPLLVNEGDPVAPSTLFERIVQTVLAEVTPPGVG